jgi:NADH pyrophosphatase NudC (nudix superfamily)
MPQNLNELAKQADIHVAHLKSDHIRTDAEIKLQWIEAFATLVREEYEEHLKLALDALEYHTKQTRPIHKTNEVIATLRNALLAPSYEFRAETINKLSDSILSSQETRCWCHKCRPITIDDMRMILCPECGNKRCPHAADHNLTCTNSNEPGQPGSAY